MTQVRVLRTTAIGEVVYKPGDVVLLDERNADRLIRLGLVAVLTATPAPNFYSNRMMRT